MSKLFIDTTQHPFPEMKNFLSDIDILFSPP